MLLAAEAAAAIPTSNATKTNTWDIVVALCIIAVLTALIYPNMSDVGNIPKVRVAIRRTTAMAITSMVQRRIVLR
jgi:hypothetical protein